MLRSGRIPASTPPLICSTGISWPGCGARVTACSPVRNYPHRGLKQLPNGDVRWTTPSGRQHVTERIRYPI